MRVQVFEDVGQQILIAQHGKASRHERPDETWNDFGFRDNYLQGSSIRFEGTVLYIIQTLAHANDFRQKHTFLKSEEAKLKVQRSEIEVQLGQPASQQPGEGSHSLSHSLSQPASQPVSQSEAVS